jgi:hypothetical protein
LWFPLFCGKAARFLLPCASYYTPLAFESQAISGIFFVISPYFALFALFFAFLPLISRF